MHKLPDIPFEDDDLFGKQQKPEEEKDQFVVFRLNAELYGMKSRDIKEVVKLERLTTLPSAPGYIMGVTNLRGMIFPVVNLKRVLGLKEAAGDADRLLVIQTDDAEFACRVDEIKSASNIPTSALEQPPLTIESIKVDFIEHACRWDEKFIAILKTGALISLFDKPVQNGKN